MLDENNEKLEHIYKKSQEGQEIKNDLSLHRWVVFPDYLRWSWTRIRQRPLPWWVASVLVINPEVGQVIGRSANDYQNKISPTGDLRTQPQIKGNYFARKYALKSQRRNLILKPTATIWCGCWIRISPARKCRRWCNPSPKEKKSRKPFGFYGGIDQIDGQRLMSDPTKAQSSKPTEASPQIPNPEKKLWLRYVCRHLASAEHPINAKIPTCVGTWFWFAGGGITKRDPVGGCHPNWNVRPALFYLNSNLR